MSVALLPQLALAQPGAEPESKAPVDGTLGPHHPRFGLGGSIGMGVMTAGPWQDGEASPMAGGASLWGGLFVAPRFMFFLEASGMGRGIEQRSVDRLSQVTGIVGAKAYFDGVVLRLGIGASRLDAVLEDKRGERRETRGTGETMLFGIGYEFSRGPTLDLDANLTFTATEYESIGDPMYTVLFGLGISLYP